MTARSDAIEAMLNPRIVAHVGASESGIYPSGVFSSLAASDLEVYPVNPLREAVFGRKCFHSVSSLPKRPDLAMVTVDRSQVGTVLEECVASGIPAAVVISSGFAEAGQEGSAFQRGLEGFAGRILVLGPNCAGFGNIPRGICATRFAGTAAAGGISFVSQSGALMMALHGSFADRGAGLRYLVSVGNQVDLGAEDLLAFFAEDEGTRVSTAFLEGLADGRAFASALEKNLAAGKPVLIVKSGRTEVGAALAATHTAAAAGEARVFEAVCRQFGAVLVDDIDELVEAALLFERYGPELGRRIAWVTQSGGLGSLTGDLAKMAGIAPGPFPPSIMESLKGGGMLPVYQEIQNPLDLRGDCMRGMAIRSSILPFAESKEIDCIVLLFAKSPHRSVEAETARAIIEAQRETGKPVIVVWVGNTAAAYVTGPGPATAAVGTKPDYPGMAPPSAVELLESAGIPVFSQSRDVVRALAHVLGYREFREASMQVKGGGNAGLH